jgi:diguanylate cyclase (GGDEF)-like protein
LIVTLTFLAAAQMIRHKFFDRFREHVLCGSVVLTIALSLTLGFVSHQATTFLINIIMCAALVWSAITYLDIRFAMTLFIAVCTIALLIPFTLLSALPNLMEKGLLLFFLVVTTAGMVNARRVQNLYSYRLFLLQLRDEQRSSEMAGLNARLTELATTDQLTKIPNRRSFDEKLGEMQAQPEVYLPMAVCIIDIDHFKILNDRLGHIQGDRCLQIVAAALRDNLRATTDFVARYGGEEFVLILARTNLAAAMQSVERLLNAVRALKQPNPDTETGFVTVSAGLAFVKDSWFDADQMLGQADRALYCAKAEGRNQLCVSAAQVTSIKSGAGVCETPSSA